MRTLHAVGFCGNDGEGFELVADLEQLGCSVRHLHRAADRQTPTYLKPCDRTVPGLEGEHSRYDTKNRCPTSQALQRSITDSLAAVVAEGDAVIVADQVEEAECGVVTSRVRAALADLAARNPRVIFWADSRLRSGSFAASRSSPTSLKRSGRKTLRRASGLHPSFCWRALVALRRDAGAPVLHHPRGGGNARIGPGTDRGARRAGRGANRSDRAPATSATAGRRGGPGRRASLPEAALVGNLVASITIQELGTTGTARPDQVRRSRLVPPTLLLKGLEASLDPRYAVPSTPTRRPMAKKRVLLLIESSRGHGRGMLEGVSQYLVETNDWHVFFEDHAVLDRLPKTLRSWEGDGMIVRSHNPKACALPARSGEALRGVARRRQAVPAGCQG